MLDPNYKPSNEDVLRARLRTTGIEEANFVFEDFAFCMIDVGGTFTPFISSLNSCRALCYLPFAR